MININGQIIMEQLLLKLVQLFQKQTECKSNPINGTGL